MRSVRRSLRDEADIEAMAALARVCPAENVHILDLPYRLSSWALDDPANGTLWTAPSGQLLAWAVLQAPFWAIDYALSPDASTELVPQVWAWADARARELLGTPHGRPAWFVSVFSDQAGRIRELEEAGFACQAGAGEDSWSKVWMRRPAGLPANQVDLPGFSIRPLAGEAEVTAYVELHRTVFESKNMTAEWRARTLRQPEYIRELDLVAVGSDGQMAGFCVGWLGAHSVMGLCGQVEPMGVRPDARGKGVGRALLAELVRRLVALGASEIFIETDSHRSAALALYESAGFRALREILVFRQDYDSR